MCSSDLGGHQRAQIAVVGVDLVIRAVPTDRYLGGAIAANITVSAVVIAVADWRF